MTTPPVLARPVAALDQTVIPGLFVSDPKAISASQVAKVRRLGFVTGAIVVDTGIVETGHLSLPTLGIDPSTFRAYTPGATATSDALWQVVAGGGAVISYEAAQDGAHPMTLGQTQGFVGQTHPGDPTLRLRLGAFAEPGLPHAHVLVSQQRGRQLGLARRRGLIVAASPQADGPALRSQVLAILGPSAHAELLGRFALDETEGLSRPGRPRTYRELYVAAARTCPGLSWTVLAAIGQIESDHGRNVGPSSAGALGPMQFLPDTFKEYGIDGDGDGKIDIMDPYDAVFSAASLLCQDGAGTGQQGLHDAVFAYNHAEWYVDEVLALSQRYSLS